MFKTDMFIHT